MSKPIIPKSLKGNIALLQITSYEAWLKIIGKKTRNMIRKAEKYGVKIITSKGSESFVLGIHAIYNEVSIRQGRRFNHYGVSLETVKAQVLASQGTFFLAYWNNALVGFIELLRNKNTFTISQILSLTLHWDKAVNNALIAKVVEHVVGFGGDFVVYARFGNHPSLDQFKRSNGFKPYRCGYRLSDFIPEEIKAKLIPIYNQLSTQQQTGENKK